MVIDGGDVMVMVCFGEMLLYNFFLQHQALPTFSLYKAADFQLRFGIFRSWPADIMHSFQVKIKKGLFSFGFAIFVYIDYFFRAKLYTSLKN